MCVVVIMVVRRAGTYVWSYSQFLHATHFDCRFSTFFLVVMDQLTENRTETAVSKKTVNRTDVSFQETEKTDLKNEKPVNRFFSASMLAIGRLEPICQYMHV